MTLNGEMALILRYFTEFGSFRAWLRKMDVIHSLQWILCSRCGPTLAYICRLAEILF